MDRQIVAICVQEAGKLLSGFLSLRSPKLKTKDYQPQIEAMPEPQELAPKTEVVEGKATSIEAGCVPCSIGHLGTCVGVTNEAMRFAKKDGLNSGEVIDRVNICLDELNALERIDLRPEMIVGLPDWEKDLANEALNLSRSTRHTLENLSNVGELESVAANLQTTRQKIGRGWFKERLERMNPEEKAKLSENVDNKLREYGDESG